jgi:apolipoprotein N-acyltransferase
MGAQDPIRNRYRQFNSAVLFDQSGRRTAQYAKRVLVPGGEYLPGSSMPDALQRRIRRAVRREAGFVSSRPAPTAWSSCRRATAPCASAHDLLRDRLPASVARAGLGGATVLVNSEQAWFRDSAEFEQYAAMAVFRAIETRRSVVKAANSGQGGWILPTGRATSSRKEGRRQGFAASGVVRPTCSDERTLYVRTGEWAGGGCSLAALALLLVRRRNRRAGRPNPASKARFALNSGAVARRRAAGSRPRFASIRSRSRARVRGGRPGKLN